MCETDNVCFWGEAGLQKTGDRCAAAAHRVDLDGGAQALS